MSKSTKSMKRARLPRRWTVVETIKLHDLGLAAFVPAGKSWPVDRVEREDFINDTSLRLGDPAADSKMLSLWIGIPHELWKTDWWRWSFEIRYRYGELSPLELLGKAWARRIREAALASFEEFTNESILRELGTEPGQPKCLRLLAGELARECIRSKRERTDLELAPWTEPVKNPTLWNYLRRTRPEHYGGPEHFRYLETADDSYEALIGRVLYFAQAAEDWHCQRATELPPDLASLNGLIEKPITPKLASNQDFRSLVVEYRARLGIPLEDFMTLLELWLDLAVYDQIRSASQMFSIVNVASGILERLRPDIHRELSSWVSRFREELIYPYAQNNSMDEAFWRTKLACFRGALEENPLLNCVLNSSIFHSEAKTKWPSYKTGRPAELNRGKASAYLVRVFRATIPKQSLISVNELTKALELKPLVRASIPTSAQYSVYALAAPMLTALFDSAVTPGQVKTNSRRYDGVLMKDQWLKRYTRRFDS